MIFFNYFLATCGIVLGALCGVVLFILLCAEAEEWWLRYREKRYERWWQNR